MVPLDGRRSEAPRAEMAGGRRQACVTVGSLVDRCLKESGAVPGWLWAFVLRLVSPGCLARVFVDGAVFSQAQVWRRIRSRVQWLYRVKIFVR